MAYQTLQEAWAHIGTTNRQFERNDQRWRFLLESYVGGEMYRDAGHLTRYTLETDGEYAARLRNTPLDNHCKSVIQVYTSFLFRQPPQRDLDSLASVELADFLRDADLDGRSFDAFMKEVAIWSSVFGHCWVLMTKPSVEAHTLSEQRAAGVRPYVNLLTPLVVTDWRWSRLPNGRYELDYFRYIEDVNDSETTIREWTPTVIRTWSANRVDHTATVELEEVNELGAIPAVICYNQRSQIRGIGLSDIDDIADMQRAIYNELSEVEQSIRMESHPSLVVTPDTTVGSGAGAMIHMPTDLDPGLKPYMLDASGASVELIYHSISRRVEAIDKMANTGGVRAVEGRTMSGIALETEFQLLNARLSEKADNLELCEEQLWQLWARYQGREWMGHLVYPDSFNLRDTDREFGQLEAARKIATDPRVVALIDQELIAVLGHEPDIVAPDLAVPPEPQVQQPESQQPLGPTYPDGIPIDPRLPLAYQSSDSAQVPDGQQCSNCVYWDPSSSQCAAWGGALVRPTWWCRTWQGQDGE